MNIRERLELRIFINLLISFVKRLINIINKFLPKPKTNHPVPSPKVEPYKPHRPRPLKKIVDTIDDIVPLPWRK